jgi:di/tricarboxylate transporter
MAMAENLGASGMPFAIIVMVGACCSFISPMGYQTNLIVYGPGRYESTQRTQQTQQTQRTQKT